MNYENLHVGMLLMITEQEILAIKKLVHAAWMKKYVSDDVT